VSTHTNGIDGVVEWQPTLKQTGSGTSLILNSYTVSVLISTDASPMDGGVCR
jgi:hypothetical protein